MTDETSLSFRVTGRVQGVWYRGWARGEAGRLGLRGWVRNQADGSVSGVICGPEPRVAEMVRRLADGPPAARVADVETAPCPPAAEAGFTIRR